MNEIKLIKSFAGYPVGVYVDIGPAYANESCGQYDNGFKYNAGYFEIHKDIVKGMKDHFEEVKERPTSWEELGEIEGYYVDTFSDIGDIKGKVLESSKNIFKTEEQAEASIALAQITQLLDKYDIPEESNTWCYKTDGACKFSTDRKGLLWFDTKEKYEHFYKHHSDLISKLAPFYIF